MERGDRFRAPAPQNRGDIPGYAESAAGPRISQTESPSSAAGSQIQRNSLWEDSKTAFGRAGPVETGSYAQGRQPM
jgi:hypothetical protein